MALTPAWWRAATPDARRALFAASLGWMLDSFDVMLYALLVATLIKEFDMTPATGGLLASLTLVASAAGGIAFGIIADRYGRTRALICSVLIYSVFTAACGLAQSVLQLFIDAMPRAVVEHALLPILGDAAERRVDHDELALDARTRARCASSRCP